MSANMSKTIKLISALFFLINSVIFSNPLYKMTIENIKVSGDSMVTASVYLENLGDEFELTSYQCALSINQDIDLSSLVLTYVAGSSELQNEPNLYVGIDNIDGPTELAFVSFIGNDIISSKTLIGNFILKGNINLDNINLLDIQWDFEGTMATILTGKDFANITNPSSFVSIFPSTEVPVPLESLQIVTSEASGISSEQYSDKKLYDGLTSSTSTAEGRWTVQGFPQWVTIDLGEDKNVDSLRLDPFGSENGITYDCEFYAGTNDNKTLISSVTTEAGVQWSRHNLGGIKTRYITMVVTGSVGNDWCDFWEMEVFGSKSATVVEDKGEEVVEEVLPTEFGISQNYPNPFNPTTKIEVRMKEYGNARLDVFNLIGERVSTILDEELSAGVHVVNIDGSRLASGVYIYKLNVGNKFSEVKKMNLIK